ncbi:hypothetical protein G6F37_010169 [Rhizopus arrhizus]|nr:hypothetical protein G6F38_010031 [Rhizopus arrhizus]KAG1153643.1 hypothetical protein G6F37_010169 [Rhizopus arrhizus]
MEGLSLGQLFSFGQNLLTELENTSLSSTDPEYQQKVNQGITYLNQAQALVAKLHLFSDNEIIDDINTNDLKFILISAYLGDLTLKLNGKDNRANILEQAKIFIQNFLTTCQTHELVNKEDITVMQQLEVNKKPAVAQQREQKIARYKREKELKQTTQQLRQQLDEIKQDDEDRDVDEMERDWVQYLIQLEIMKALENWNAIEQEMVMLKEMEIMREMMEKRGQSSTSPTAVDQVSSRANWGRDKPLLNKEGRPLQPFVITGKREQLKNQVFGPGYNLPTMTIDQYLEQEMERGNIIQGGGEPPEKEEIDDNDYEALDAETMKKREWDEFVEANPRGAGNRGNKG